MYAEEATKNTSEHLSIGPQKQKRAVTLDVPRGRSSSVSTDTMVPDTPNGEIKAAIKRRGTYRADVKISYMDILKGLFTGAKSLKQKLAARVHLVYSDEDRVEHLGPRQHPYILDVSVYKPGTSQYIPARCVLDTGNTQGNIISEGLVHRLGFTKLHPLEQSEKHGGKVATGHIHQVKGAVFVSWCHKTSPKVFGGMRFLVSESEEFDLVVGVGSICRENLIPAPNFGMYAQVSGKKDTKRVSLGEREQKLETDIIKLEKKIKALGKGPEVTDEVKAYEKEKSEYMVELEGVQKEIDDYEKKKAESAKPAKKEGKEKSEKPSKEDKKNDKKGKSKRKTD